MCLACEEDSIWLAYLESRGLLQPDNPEAAQALFAAFPVQPLPTQPEQSEQPETREGVPAKAEKNPFSCDDPTAG